MAKTQLESRHERLAAALRANLKRRKAAGRASSADRENAPEPTPEAAENIVPDDEALPPPHKPR